MCLIVKEIFEVKYYFLKIKKGLFFKYFVWFYFILKISVGECSYVIKIIVCVNNLVFKMCVI